MVSGGWESSNTRPATSSGYCSAKTCVYTPPDECPGEDIGAVDPGPLEACGGPSRRDTISRSLGGFAPAHPGSVVDADLGSGGHAWLDPSGNLRGRLAEPGFEDHGRTARARAADVELVLTDVDRLAGHRIGGLVHRFRGSSRSRHRGLPAGEPPEPDRGSRGATSRAVTGAPG